MSPLIYLLDDDLVFLKLLKANLGSAGEFRIHLFTDPSECLDAVSQSPPHILITDLYMEALDGIEVARRARKLAPTLPIFVLTAEGGVASAVEAMRAGANEYLLKPVNVTELSALIRDAMRLGPLISEGLTTRRQRREQYSVDAILGEHPLVAEARTFIRGIGPARRASVLLLGESGTGKNLAAQAIHLADTNARGQFVELNCAALPPALLEAELFGYMRGAFTGATENKPGLVEVADGGSLFLDEIGEMPMELQVKLLNFLESQRFRRLGATREREVDVRIIAATNRPVEELLSMGQFRSDLFYRISTATHTLPPLRNLGRDVLLLADHFARIIAADLGKPFDHFSEGAQALLLAWPWPGNTRELRNAVERALIFSRTATLGAEDLPGLERGRGGTRGAGDASTVQIALGLTLAEVEGAYIRETLSAHEGRIQEAATSLGISRKSLWERRKRHSLDP